MFLRRYLLIFIICISMTFFLTGCTSYPVVKIGDEQIINKSSSWNDIRTSYEKRGDVIIINTFNVNENGNSDSQFLRKYIMRKEGIICIEPDRDHTDVNGCFMSYNLIKEYCNQTW